MSTRALYTFKGQDTSDTWNVYKHHDGYPTGAANVLKLTLDYFAWPLPRYEADAFAAGFCAAGKSVWMDSRSDTVFDQSDFENYGPGGSYRWCSGGGVRLMPQGKPDKVVCQNCTDIEYRYEIYQSKLNNGELWIRAYSVNAWEKYSETLLTDCKLSDFAAWAKEDEAKQNAV